MKEWGRWGDGEERDKDDDEKEEDMRAEDLEWWEWLVGVCRSDLVPPRARHMTLQTAVSAHAAVLVIRRLKSMQSHANSRQAGGSCIVCLGLGQRQARPGRARPCQAWPAQSCTGHAVTLLLREEREREESTVRRRRSVRMKLALI